MLSDVSSSNPNCVLIPFHRDGVSEPAMLLNPSVPGSQKPRAKRDSKRAFFRAQVLRKYARTLVLLDPNAMFSHDVSKTPVTQRFVGNCGAAERGGAYCIWVSIINYTINERKCQFFLIFQKVDGKFPFPSG